MRHGSGPDLRGSLLRVRGRASRALGVEVHVLLLLADGRHLTRVPEYGVCGLLVSVEVYGSKQEKSSSSHVLEGTPLGVSASMSFEPQAGPSSWLLTALDYEGLRVYDAIRQGSQRRIQTRNRREREASPCLGRSKKGDGKRGTAHFTHLRLPISQTLRLLRGKNRPRVIKLTYVTHFRFPPFPPPPVCPCRVLRGEAPGGRPGYRYTYTYTYNYVYIYIYIYICTYINIYYRYT